MNHYISGIIKIILIEASAALLIVDLVAPDRFARARALGRSVLAGLMVFAWCNYGALRMGVDPLMSLTSVPLILACGWLVAIAFGPAQRLESVRNAPAPQVTRWLGVAAFIAVLELATLVGAFPVARGSQAAGELSGWLVAAGVASFAVSRVALQARDRLVSLLATGGRPLAVGLCVVLSASWVGAGVLSNRLTLVHPWEQYHFLLGAKYQRELGWFNLYKATIIADRESINALAGLEKTRELRDFTIISRDRALEETAAIKARFSDERWTQFKNDWVTMAGLWHHNWAEVMNDHGNSNSPTWAIIAHPIASLTPITVHGQALVGSVDMLLMLGLWLAIWQAFGPQVAAVGLFVWAMPPNSFEYLSGSVLRWDWLFAVGMAAVALKKERFLLAGGFFGFAISTKLFPIFFGVALAMRAGWVFWETRTFPKRYVQFLAGTAVVGALTVAISAAMFGPSSWKEYAERIQVSQTEKFYAIQYSLKTVYLQHASGSLETWAQAMVPNEIRQSRADVNADDYALGFLVARLVFALFIAWFVRRADDVEAFTTGPLLVFVFLTVNMYYWNMLGLLALGLAARLSRPRQTPALAVLLGLHGIFMVFYLHQHLNRGAYEGYLVAWFLTVLIAAAGLWERAVTADEASAAQLESK